MFVDYNTNIKNTNSKELNRTQDLSPPHTTSKNLASIASNTSVKKRNEKMGLNQTMPNYDLSDRNDNYTNIDTTPNRHRNKSPSTLEKILMPKSIPSKKAINTITDNNITSVTSIEKKSKSREKTNKFTMQIPKTTIENDDSLDLDGYQFETNTKKNLNSKVIKAKKPQKIDKNFIYKDKDSQTKNALNTNTEDSAFTSERFHKFEEFWKSINEMKKEFYEKLNKQAIDISNQNQSNNPYIYKENISQDFNLLNRSVEELLNKSLDNTKLDDLLNFSHNSKHHNQEPFLINDNNRPRSNSPFTNNIQDNNRKKGQLDSNMDKSREFYQNVEANSPIYPKQSTSSGYQDHDFATKNNLLYRQILEKYPYQGSNNNSYQTNINDGYFGNSRSSNSANVNSLPRDRMSHDIGPGNINTIDNRYDNHKKVNESIKGVGNISTTIENNQTYLLRSQHNELEFQLLKFKKEKTELEELNKEKEDIINILKRQVKEKTEENLREKYDKDKELMKLMEANQELYKEKQRMELILDDAMNKLETLQKICIQNGVQVDKLKKENRILENALQEKRTLENKIQEYENSLKLQLTMNNDLKQRLNSFEQNKSNDSSSAITKEIKLQEALKNAIEEIGSIKKENFQLRENLSRISIKPESNPSPTLKNDYQKPSENAEDKLTKQLEVIKLQNKELQESLLISKRENEQLALMNEAELKKLKDKIMVVMEENEKKSAEINDLNDSLRQTKEFNQMTGFNTKNNEDYIEKICKEYESKINEYIEKNKLLQKKLDDSLVAYKSLEQNCQKQQDMINQLSVSVNSATNSSEKLTSDQQVQISELKNEIRQLINENQQLKNKNQQFEIGNQQIENENQQLKIQIQDQKNENSRLAVEILQAKKENELLKANLQQIQKDNQQLTSNNLQLKNENKGILSEIDALKQKLETLTRVDDKAAKIDQSRVNSLQADSNSKLKQTGSLNSDSENLLNELARLRERDIQLLTELANLRTENTKLLGINSELKTMIDSLNQQVIKANNINEIESDLETAQKQIIAMSTEIMKLKSENDKLSSLLKIEQNKGPDKLKNEIKDLNNTIDKLKTENKNLTKTLTENEKKLKNSLNEIENLKQSIAKISSKDKSAAAYEDLKKEYDKFKDDTRIKIQKLEQKISEMEIYSVQNQQLKTMFEESEAKNKTLTESLTEMEYLSFKVKNYEEQIEAFQKNDPNLLIMLKNESINRGINEYKDKIAKLTQELETQKKSSIHQQEILNLYEI